MQGRFSGSDFNHVPFLTPSQVEERLHQFELEFADRYSKKDDYYRYANRVKKAPVPVIKPWPPLSYKRFNYRKEVVLHRHRNEQRNNRNRPPYHRDVHARLGRFGKSAQAHKPRYTGSSSPVPSPSHAPLPGEVADGCPFPELLASPEIELEVSGGEEGTRDLTETSSCYLSDDPVAQGTPVIQQSPLSQQSVSSHENPHTPLCEPQQRSPFSPGTGTGSDTPGEAKLLPARLSPAASDPCTPEPHCPPTTLRQDQQGPKRVNLANLSSIQSANGRKLNKDSRSSSCKLISNILASTDYSLDRPKPSFPSHGQKVPPSHTAPPEETPPLHVSIPLEQVRVAGPRGRSLSKKQRKEPIAPVRIKLTGQTWQLESARKN